ncbi:uncharacterized protein LOC144093039 [Stigmatopora argus]
MLEKFEHGATHSCTQSRSHKLMRRFDFPPKVVLHCQNVPLLHGLPLKSQQQPPYINPRFNMMESVNYLQHFCSFGRKLNQTHRGVKINFDLADMRGFSCSFLAPIAKGKGTVVRLERINQEVAVFQLCQRSRATSSSCCQGDGKLSQLVQRAAALKGMDGWDGRNNDSQFKCKHLKLGFIG